MRLTLIIHSLDGGGAERQVAMIANHFARSGHHVDLITLDLVDNDRYPVDASINRIGLDMMRVSRNLWQGIRANMRRIRAVREAIHKTQPDCIFSFTDKMNLITLPAVKPGRVPLVICEMSDPRRQKLGLLWEAARRRYYPRCDYCVTLTPQIAEYLRPIIKNKPAVAIPSGIIIPDGFTRDEIDLQRRPRVDRSNILLAVGRLSIEKGFDRLLQAWSIAASQLPQWELQIAGEGPARVVLERLAQHFKIADRVRWLGWQSDIWNILAAADAFVVSSRYEGFPLAILEAMAAGLPVITIDCTDALQAIMEHGKSGWIVPSGESDSATARLLGQALVEVLTQNELTQRLGTQARDAVHRFAWSQVAQQWDELLSAVTR